MIPYSLNCIGRLKSLPISLKEVKDYLKISHSEEDELLNEMIKTASIRFEKYTSQALLMQTWQVTYRQCARVSLTLPISPAQEIVQIKLTSLTGHLTTFDKSCYELDTKMNELVFDIYPYSYLLRIEFKAGYGTKAEDIPTDIKSAILSHLAHAYEHRGVDIDHLFSAYDEFKTYKL